MGTGVVLVKVLARGHFAHVLCLKHGIARWSWSWFEAVRGIFGLLSRTLPSVLFDCWDSNWLWRLAVGLHALLLFQFRLTTGRCHLALMLERDLLGEGFRSGICVLESTYLLPFRDKVVYTLFNVGYSYFWLSGMPLWSLRRLWCWTVVLLIAFVHCRLLL